MSDEVLVRVEGVSKKFCRSLKRSLWYGVKDVSAELLGRKGSHNDLRKNEFWAVDNVSFELKRGECLGLIGPNGAGKSTLLKMLNGLVKPDKGRIRMRGRVGALIELGAGFNPILTARENIYVNGSVLGLSKKEIDRKFDAIVDFAELEDFIDTPVQNFSSGMKVRLGFAVAAQMEPDVLLIDEILAVGDVGFRMKCFKHLLTLRSLGTSIIVVSHGVHELSRATERCAVMDSGEYVFDGKIATAIAKYDALSLPDSNSSQESRVTSSRIESVNLFDEQGSKSTEFLTGDSISIELLLTSRVRVPNARLIVAIESPAIGMLGSISSPYKGFKFDLEFPHTRVQLRLLRIPLLVGSYALNVSLFGPEIDDFMDRRSPAACFSIVGPSTNDFGYGITNHVKFEHNWRLVS